MKTIHFYIDISSGQIVEKQILFGRQTVKYKAFYD